MLRMTFFVSALLISASSVSAQEIGRNLLGLWAKEKSYCRVLKSQGDLTKLNRIFDYNYIYFKKRIFYIIEDTPYYVMRVFRRSNNSGTIEFSNEITSEIGDYQYEIRYSGSILTIIHGIEKMVFHRC